MRTSIASSSDFFGARMSMKPFLHRLFASLGCCSLWGTLAVAQPVDVAALAALQNPAREVRLTEGARKEGELNVYTSLVVDDIQNLAAAFEKKYGVKVKYWRASSEKVVQRIVTEARANRFDFDVVETNGPELEALYRDWHKLDPSEWHDGFAGLFPCLRERQAEILAGFTDERLAAQLAANADLMEACAVLIFAQAAKSLGDAAPPPNANLNPYAVSLDPDRWEADGLLSDSGLSADEARQGPAAGLETWWMDVVAQPG